MKRTILSLVAAFGLSAVGLPAVAQEKPAGEAPGEKPMKKHKKMKEGSAAEEKGETPAEEAKEHKGKHKKMKKGGAGDMPPAK